MSFRSLLPSLSTKATSASFRQVSRYLLMMGLLSGALLLSLGAQAQVAYATGGSGKYKNNIAWLTWGGGTNGTNAVTITSTNATNSTSITVGSNTLVVTAALSNYTAGSLRSYRSGNYGGDGLDDAYNIGGAGGSNRLISGLINTNTGALVSFTLTLSATFNGVAIDIPSVVLADAESSGATEYVEMSADGNWSAMEIVAACSNTYNAVVSAGTGTTRTLRLASPSGNCSSTTAGPDGLVSLAFNSSAYTNHQTVLNATVKGGGASALAIGLILPFDYGDAPASSYGYATHLIPQIFDSQLAAGTTTNINATGYSFASLTSPALRLGSLIDADNNNYTGSAAITQDDNNLGAGGTNDEDGISFSAIPNTSSALSQTVASYSVTASVYNATGQAANLVGWIDWNNNGAFDASEAAVASVASSGSNTNVTLTWTNQTLSGSYGQSGVPARFRLTTDALTASTPSGGASNGEVEDYLIPLAQPLPVTLVSFTAKAVGACAAELGWQTASERNSDYYEVQRSADGVTFTPLGTVASRNSAAGAGYSYRDSAPLGAENYYRLRQVDLDGTSTYSPVAVAVLACDGAASLALIPNPASSSATIQGLRPGQQLQVYAADGRLLYKDNAVETTQRLAIAEWPTGLYLVRVRNVDGSLAGTLRLVKE